MAAWFERLLNSSDWVGLPWVTIWSFLRITTNPKIFSRPLTPAQAFQAIDACVELPNVALLQPGPRHRQILERLITRGQASGPMVTDAVLAAIAIEQGATLASTDRDFSRFPGLDWLNPLELPS